MAATVAAKRGEAERLMRSGFGITATADDGADLVRVKRCDYNLPGDQLLPEAGRTLEHEHAYTAGDGLTAYFGP